VQQPPACLITGGSSGIGLATVKRFAAAGWQTAIVGRDRDRLDQARAAATAVSVPPADCQAIVFDLARGAAESGRLVERVVEHTGRLDVLVNNAGTAILAPLAEMNDADIEAMIDLNFRAVVYLTRRALPLMQRQGHGVIINVSSIAAVDPFAGFDVYGATKAAVELFTLAVAREGQPHVAAYCVRPGAVDTPLLRRLFPQFPRDETADPREVANVIFELATGARPDVAPGATVTVSRQRTA
jgi:NAD(P)-dependent dehydrogenase (short-subunit alcohol dehydrogenase family)